MKSVYVSNVRTVVMSVLATIIVFFGYTSVNAQVLNGNDKVIPVELKYVGSLDGNDLLAMQIINAKNEALTVSFVDEDGEELYSEVFSGTVISKKFLLDIPDFGAKKIFIHVSSAKLKIHQTYSVQKNIQQTTEVIVARR